LAEDKSPKFKITTENLNSESVKQTVDHIKRAKEIVLVREVGAPSNNRDGLITIAVLSAAGLVSGLFTWFTWMLLPDIDDVATSNILSAVTIALVIAITLVLADAALSRSAAKLGRYLLIAVPVALVASLMFGFIAHSIYSYLTERNAEALFAIGLTTDNPAFWEEFYSRNHLSRGIAWSFLGLAAGIAVGITSLAIKRVLITAGGGFVGGFIGGFLFDYFEGEAVAQISGLVITGGAVGLAVSLLEQVTKSSWLEIVKGGMAGKQFILYQNSITIGSSPSANITLIKDNAIPPIAALIKKFGNNVTISSAAPGVAISVDGVSAFEHRLKEGSLIVLGGTEVRFRERSKQINNSSIQRG
jgi:hypothetical protein